MMDCASSLRRRCPANLQEFVLKHLGEDELFEKPDELIRKTSGAVP
jgi:hypothetical protein